MCNTDLKPLEEKERDVGVFGDGVGLEARNGIQVLAAEYCTLVDIASGDVEGVTTHKHFLIKKYAIIGQWVSRRDIVERLRDLAEHDIGRVD
jgi:hypothetical protein